MDQVTAGNIRDIHDEIIADSGGTPGVLNIGSLDHIVFKSNRKNNVIMAAAVLLHGIITMHPFYDGNKRTGFVVADLLLRRHGYIIKADEEEIIDLLLRVASYTLYIKEIEAWITENIVKA